MKKVLSICLILMCISLCASAQTKKDSNFKKKVEANVKSIKASNDAERCQSSIKDGDVAS